MESDYQYVVNEKRGNCLVWRTYISRGISISQPYGLRVSIVATVPISLTHTRVLCAVMVPTSQDLDSWVGHGGPRCS